MNDRMKVDEHVEFEVNSLDEALLTVRDKRKAGGKGYGLVSVLTLSVVAKWGGEDEPQGMAEWVKRRAEQWRASVGIRRPSMAHAVPYRRGLGQAIDVAEFEQGVAEFFKRCQGRDAQLAMDGKSLRDPLEVGQTRGVHGLAV